MEYRLSIAAMGALLASSVPAYAQHAEASTLFDAGNEAMKQGKLAEACDSFEASNRIEPGAGTLLRLGDCREQRHQLSSAWSAYKDALARAKDPQKKAMAAAKVAALEARLSFLTVSVPQASMLAGLEVTRDGKPFDHALWNRAVPIDGGDYAIAASAPGHREWKVTAHVPDEGGKITVAVPKLDTPEAPAAAPPRITPTAVDHGEPSRWTGKRKLAVVAGGVAIAGAAAGAVLGVLANQQRDRADALCPMTVCANAPDASTATADIQSARSRALGANVAFGVAGAAAIAAGVLWFTGAPERAHVAAVVAPGTAALTIAGHF